MVKEIQIYIEGAAKGHASKDLRKGFAVFFDELRQKAREKNIRFQPIICGSTDQTFKIFKSVNSSSEGILQICLVDSDKPVGEKETAKSFLQSDHKSWDLENIEEDQCHLMVQIMESWFLADIEALKSFYGKDFTENKIPENPNVEEIRKSTVEKSLKEATRKTQKGEYHKTRHGSGLLQIISPQKVREMALFCNRLFEVVSEKIN